MKKRILIGTFAVFAGVFLVLVGLNMKYRISQHQQFFGTPRKHWKESAIAAVAGRAADPVWLTNETAKIKAELARDDQAWFSRGLLLMRDGEWLIGTNICSKEDARIHDLFIGRGQMASGIIRTFIFASE